MQGNPFFHGLVEPFFAKWFEQIIQCMKFKRLQGIFIESRGEDHARIFVVQCSTVEPDLCEQAEGSSLRLAEMAAAEKLMIKLEALKQ